MLARLSSLAPAAARRAAPAAAAGAQARQMSEAAVATDVVELQYDDLAAGKDLSADIERAYGPDGLGILSVAGIPDFVEKRQALLPLGSRLANLGPEKLAKLEHPDSYYSFGWSHGKEILQGRPDYGKGSFYANPMQDAPTDDEELIKAHPAFLTPNIWPTEDMPELRGAFMGLGQLMVGAGALVAQQVDAFVRSVVPAYPPTSLHDIVVHGDSQTGRLLHYYSLTEAEAEALSADDDAYSSSCGWHNDHGSLTLLTPACYQHEDNIGVEIDCPDPEAGLYIRARDGRLLKGVVPRSNLLMQIGETAMVMSGGAVEATPHAVRAPSTPGVVRDTFAVFCGPNWDARMQLPEGRTVGDVENARSAAALPPGVPPLTTRWTNGQTNAEFSEATFQKYYDLQQ